MDTENALTNAKESPNEIFFEKLRFSFNRLIDKA